MLQKLRSSSVTTQIKLYADGASLEDFTRLYREGAARGFTTNPTLMHRAGVTDYESFAKALIAAIPDRPISFEVFSDDFEEMEIQARKIAAWGDNVYVKIPISNTLGHRSLPLVARLSKAGVKLNVTAILTLEQAVEAISALDPATPAVVSIFAGRIADTGQNPEPVMRAAVAMAAAKPLVEILWASIREPLNVYQAADCGCHIITITPDIFKKLAMEGKDLDALSLETVQMFRTDALSAGFAL